MSIIRHTDAEVLQELADILWPYKDPERQWSSDTVQEIADTLALLRPELLPWSMGCLAYHGWAQNAYDCARQRETNARIAFIRGTGSHDAVDAEVDTVWALETLLHSGDDDD